MLYVDVTSSCKSPMNTGVQRVVRGLFRAWSAALGPAAVVPVLWEPRLTSYCTLSPRERGFLERPFAGRHGRRALAEPGRVANALPVVSKWWRQVVHGRNRLGLPRLLTAADTLFVPEIFQDGRIEWLSRLGVRCPARRVAVCHDAIGWRRPDLTLAVRREGFANYLNSLRTFDGVLAVSREAADDLAALWREQGPDGAGPIPPVRVAGWPADDFFVAPVEAEDLPPAPASALPQVLCVGTFEPRKNHPALLAAAEILWAEGVRFELVLAGRTTAEWGETVEARIAELRAAGRTVDWRRHVSDETLRALYRRCRFTVFPSLAEGFGIPIVESLRHGRPCVCGSNGALGELSAGGGCLVVDHQADPTRLADGLRRLLADDALHAQLSAEARTRVFPTWTDYVRETRSFLLPAVGGSTTVNASKLNHHAQRELRAEV